MGGLVRKDGGREGVMDVMALGFWVLVLVLGFGRLVV